MKPTPHIARTYLLIAAFLIALPTLASFYNGQTGRLLVAVGQLAEGGPFEQSVVYIVEHNLFSAHGYIINRPMLPHEAEKILGGNKVDIPVFYGGPVGHPSTAAVLTKAEQGILPIPYEVDIAYEDGWLMFGYAGWGPLQLNYEIVRGGWDVIDFDETLVFETKPGDMWDRARQMIFENLKPRDKGIL